MTKKSKSKAPESHDAALAARLVIAREATGLSTAQLARRLGIKTRTLTAWEAGEAAPRANRLVMLSGFLNVSPSWLLTGEGTPPDIDPITHDIAALKGEIRHLRALHNEMAVIVTRLETALNASADHLAAAEDQDGA